MTNARELTLRLQELLARERVAMADFLVAVADFDRRALWLDLGYASLFAHLSKREAKAVAAEILPDEAPPRRDEVTALRAPAEGLRLALSASGETPAPAAAASFSLGVVRPDEPDRASAPLAPVPPRPAPSPAPPPSTVEPLTAELIRIHFTARKEFAEKLEKAKDALSHSRPAAGIAEVLEAGLDLLIERHAKRRGLVERPRATPPPSSNPEYVGELTA